MTALYKASRHLMVRPLAPPWNYVCHALLGNRRVYHLDALGFLDLFRHPSTPLDALDLGIDRGLFVPPQAEQVEDWYARIQAFVLELLRAKLLWPADEDEDDRVLEEITARWGAPDGGVRATALGAMEDTFAPVVPTSLGSVPPPTSQRVSFLLLGWCFTQSVGPVLQELAAQRGMDAQVHAGFHADLHLVDTLKPDVTVLQLSHRMVLAPLLDGYAQATPEQRQQRIRQACALVTRSVQDALARVGPSLLLVQGVALPQTSPLGLREHRDPPGVFAALHAVNTAAAEATAVAPNALFVDEDVLLSSVGKRHVLDDLVSTFSHHGALGFDPVHPSSDGRAASFDLADRLLLHRTLAQAYLDHFVAWQGKDAIRVIAVDLDNTLWPGNIGDEGFTFDSDDLSVDLMYGRHGGIHEALRILKDRGILLAVVSRNSEEQVLSRWTVDKVPLAYEATAADTRHYLRPDDFVRLKINWGHKSASLAELMTELGVTARQVCFVDDNPVERAEVAHAHPEMMILGEDLNHVRRVLLTDPRFDSPSRTEEAAARTHTTRARLQREDAAANASDHGAFLRSLQVTVTVRRETTPERLARMAELLARTNQFNTTHLRLSDADLREAMAHPQADVLSMDVADRFASYGLVGVAVVVGTRVEVFAMSCRVLGLEAERALLEACIHAARNRGAELEVPFVDKGGRNLPATRLFELPGCTRRDDGTGVFSLVDTRPALPDHLTVR